MFGLLQKLLQGNKALVSGAGVAATALTFAHTLFGGNTAVGTAFAILTPLLTWLVPNAKAK